MIKLEIIESADRESIGTYQFEFDEIQIGYLLKNDIIIRDKSWKEVSLLLKVMETGLKIKTAEDQGSFVSNGKKVQGAKIHKKNDVLALGNTSLKIIDFKISTPEPTDLINRLYQERLEKNPELLNLFEAIEKELRELK